MNSLKETTSGEAKCSSPLLLWRYSPTRTLASLILRFQISLSYVELLQFLRFDILITFLSTASIHLPLGLPLVFPYICILPILYQVPSRPSFSSHDPPTRIYSRCKTFTGTNLFMTVWLVAQNTD